MPDPPPAIAALVVWRAGPLLHSFRPGPLNEAATTSKLPADRRPRKALKGIYPPLLHAVCSLETSPACTPNQVRLRAVFGGRTEGLRHDIDA